MDESRWSALLAGCAVAALGVTALVALPSAPAVAAAAGVAAPALGTVQPVSIDGNTGREVDASTAFDLPMAISTDGRYVLFCSDASLDSAHPLPVGLIECYQRDRQAGTTKLVTFAAGGATPTDNPRTDIVMSRDGRYVAYEFSGDPDVLRYDTQSGAVVVVGHGPTVSAALTPTGGFTSYVAVSADGRYALSGTTSVRIDLQTGAQVNYATAGDGTPADPNSVNPPGAAMSADGRFVVFWSNDYSLLPGVGSPCPTFTNCGRLYRKDLDTGAIALVDVTDGGQPGMAGGAGPAPSAAISDDGSKVAFESLEQLGTAHVRYGLSYWYSYVHDFSTGRTHLISGTPYYASASSSELVISGDGTTTAWTTQGTGAFVSNSSTDAATRHLTALRADPADQTTLTGFDRGTPDTIYGSFDDGTEQPIPPFGWRRDSWPTNTLGARLDGDHFIFYDSSEQSVQLTVGLLDDTDISTTFTINFVHPTVTIRADNQTITQGNPDPVFTYMVTGLDPGDSLTRQPTCGVALTHSGPGTYPITCQGAQAPGYDFAYQSGTLTVKDKRLATTTTLTTSAQSVAYAKAVTLTATVRSSDGSGGVMFQSDGVAIDGCRDKAMTSVFMAYRATCTTNALTPGYHHVIATYLGSFDYAPSSGTLTKDELVKAATKLTASPVNVADPNGRPTYRAALTRTADGAPVVGMTVTFQLSAFYGSSSCTAITDSQGVAACQAARPRRSGGQYTAKFAGAIGYNASSGTAKVTI